MREGWKKLLKHWRDMTNEKPNLCLKNPLKKTKQPQVMD
jgi:hypothetical protein